jgi:DNA helicase-2/ATP-dependent DNA helicase PcrA
MRSAYSDNSDESINKLANIEEFITSVDDYCRLNEGATLTDYLNQVTLSSDTDEMDDSDYVTLATIHSVKGLEFKCVFIVGLEENILPVSRSVESPDDLEEERRLAYVAITRAREKLYLTRSKSRYLYGRREPTARSRFLKELASEIELPKEQLRTSYGYGADGYGDDDPESYGNSAYGSARYQDRNNSSSYGSRNSYGSSYGSSYSGSSYGASTPKRSPWMGGSSAYGGTGYGNSSSTRSSGYTSSYGSGAYGSAQSSSSSRQSGGTVYGGIGGVNKPKPTATKDLSAFKIGVKVKHPKFGEGTIVGVRGVGANMILDIAFVGLGIKQLSASLAPLSVLP